MNKSKVKKTSSKKNAPKASAKGKGKGKAVKPAKVKAPKKEIPVAVIPSSILPFIRFSEANDKGTRTVQVSTQAARVSVIDMLPVATPEQAKDNAVALKTTGYAILKVNKLKIVAVGDVDKNGIAKSAALVLEDGSVRITDDMKSLFKAADKARKAKAGKVAPKDATKGYIKTIDQKTRVLAKRSKAHGCQVVSHLMMGK